MIQYFPTQDLVANTEDCSSHPDEFFSPANAKTLKSVAGAAMKIHSAFSPRRNLVQQEEEGAAVLVGGAAPADNQFRSALRGIVESVREFNLEEESDAAKQAHAARREKQLLLHAKMAPAVMKSLASLTGAGAGRGAGAVG